MDLVREIENLLLVRVLGLCGLEPNKALTMTEWVVSNQWVFIRLHLCNLLTQESSLESFSETLMHSPQLSSTKKKDQKGEEALSVMSQLEEQLRYFSLLKEVPNKSLSNINKCLDCQLFHLCGLLVGTHLP